MISAADEVAPNLLAQVTPRRVGEKRFHARAGVGDDPLTGQIRGVSAAAAAAVRTRFRQAGQVPGLGQHGGHLFLVSQEVLIEGGEQGGQTLVDGGDPRFGGGIQPGAGPDELGVMMPDQPLFLRGQPALFGRFDRRRRCGQKASRPA
jgi:hypothetical protein